MPLEINLVRTWRGLEPVDDHERDKLMNWRIGQQIDGKYSVPRNPSRLRWWWKLCAIVSENHDMWPTREAVSDSLKAELGIFETYYERNARGVWEEKRKPGSIALKNMEEDDFRRFCVQAHNVVSTTFLGCGNEELEAALDAYLNPYENDGRAAA